MGVDCTLSPRSSRPRPTPFQSLRRAAPPARARGARPGAASSPADRPYPWDYHPDVSDVLNPGALPRKAWYPRPDGRSQQPGVSPRSGATRARRTGLAGPENPRLPTRVRLGLSVNPFGNFSDTSGFRSRTTKGSLGHSFEVRIITGDRNQGSFYPFVRHEISLLVELPFGHPCCLLTDVPPQPNSPPNDVFGLGAAGRGPPGLP